MRSLVSLYCDEGGKKEILLFFGRVEYQNFIYTTNNPKVGVGMGIAC